MLYRTSNRTYNCEALPQLTVVSLGAKRSAHPPSLKIPTPVQVNVSRIIKEHGTNDKTGPAHTSRILW